jgi:A/G-specific adenine glycosylase
MFGETLCRWYQAVYRKLPWRETQDPYAIWVSEVMLQQTQVATVLPYYQRFLAQFPTIAALAAAPPELVLKAWEGLGYYARVRNLQKAAQQLVQTHGGQFPTQLSEVEKLPGIGKSTAGAILTFACQQRHPILDGNVKRVLCRVFDIDTPPTENAPALWERSLQLLNTATDAATFNQAIMELGATVCTPTQPKCLVCPVQQECLAFARGTVPERPVKVAKKATPHHTIAVGLIWHNGQLYIQKRPESGLLGGLWEFPGGKQEPGEALEATVAREILEETGMTVTVGAPLTTVKHAYTHFRITLTAFHCQWQSGESTFSGPWQWVPPETLTQFPFPKANLKVLAALETANSMNFCNNLV